MIEQVAFLQFGRIGDMLLASSILHDFKQVNPNTRVTWISLDCYRDLLAGNPDIDNYIAWPTHPNVDRIQMELAAWDNIVQYAQRHQQAGVFNRIIAPQCYPSNRWESQPGVHLLDQMYGYSGVDRLKSRIHMFDGRRKCKKKTSVVTCNSGSLTQQPVWTAEQWDELREGLLERGIELIDGDRESNTLTQWYDKIRKSRFYIGGNSGGSWMAAAAGIDQIVLRGTNSCTPLWLDGIEQSGLKESGLTLESHSMSPIQAVEKVVEVAK